MVSEVDKSKETSISTSFRYALELKREQIKTGLSVAEQEAGERGGKDRQLLLFITSPFCYLT